MIIQHVRTDPSLFERDLVTDIPLEERGGHHHIIIPVEHGGGQIEVYFDGTVLFRPRPDARAQYLRMSRQEVPPEGGDLARFLRESRGGM